MIFHSEPKFSLNPWESQFLKCKVEEVFVGFVPCSTSHPFFPMTLMPLWFLVFKGHDLLHTQVYMYVYMYTPVKLHVKLHMYISLKKKKRHLYVYLPKRGA